MQPELIALKVALVFACVGPAVFITVYHRLTKGAAWKNSIGLTIQLEALLFMVALLPLLLAAFWHLNALGNAIGSWILITCLGLCGIVMFWRAWVFLKISKDNHSKAVESALDSADTGSK